MHSQIPAKQRDGDELVERLQRLMGLTAQVSFCWDVVTDAIEWDGNFASFVGLKDALRADKGRSFETLLLMEHDTGRFSRILENKSGSDDKPSQNYEISFAISEKHVEGDEPVWLEESGVVYRDENGVPLRVEGIVRSISERRKRERKLQRRSDYDELTGLANRRCLEERLTQTIQECIHEEREGALLILEISRLNLVNEIYGFMAGDEILCKAGQIVASRIRENDLVARFSGAKLAILLNECNLQEIYSASRRFLAALDAEKIRTTAGPVSLSARIGACQVPRRARTTGEAIVAATAACNLAGKEHGGIHVHHWDESEHLSQLHEMHVATQVITAIENKNMHLAYQPVVHAGNGRTVFHEVLARIKDESGNVIPAGEFLPLASRLGFASAVDRFVMETAVTALRENEDTVLSINVSNETAEDTDWLSRLANQLDGNQQLAGRLIVEITESHAASDLAETRKFVTIVKSLGCRVAVDDFGAGFTSFANLKILPVDMIKIDGAFAENLIHDERNRVFIQSLLSLAKAFDVETVVEWVEDHDTAELLAQWGVDYLQGNCFGKAIDAMAVNHRSGEQELKVLAG